MSRFLLNPYDAPLDLADKDDRKLYQEACKGLRDKDLFDGKRENYSNFLKLIEKDLSATRLLDSLKIHTIWDAHASTLAGQKIPKTNGLIDIFKSNKATKEQVEEHVNLVWSDSTYGVTTPKYFTIFDSAPTDTDTLNSLRNTAKLKHVMMGAKLWNSLTSGFQIDIQNNQAKFQREQECDGPLLFDFIRRRVNPSTTVGASKLKDEIEAKTLADFKYSVTAYNTWFEDTRESIVKEEGTGYNEYMRSLFRAYLTSSNTEFTDAIASERRDWIQCKVKADYSYLDLMELGRLTYNNLIEDESWIKKEATQEKEKNYLALATQLMTQFAAGKYKPGEGNNNNGNNDRDKGNDQGPRTYHKWRYENPDNAATKEVRGSTMKWCSNDCHDKPMWCGRKNCINRADYATAMQKKRDNKDSGSGGTSSSNSSNSNVSKEFKIALAAYTSAEDYAALEAQFFS